MPTPVAYSTSTTQIGIAIETVRGSAPSQPKYMFPVKAPKYKPDLTYIPDDTLQGSRVEVYDMVPGMRYDTHGWDAPPYLDSFPILARLELGSSDSLTTAPASTTLSTATAAGSSTISTAASIAAGSWITFGSGNATETHKVASVSGTGPFTVSLTSPVVNGGTTGAVTGLTGHTFSLLNNQGSSGDQPPTASIWDGDGEEWRLLTAGTLDELSLKGNATGLVDYTCTWFANGAQANATAPSTSYTTIQTPAPWTWTFLLGGTEQVYVEDWEFTFKNQVKPIMTLSGTQQPFLYFAGALQATGKLTLVEQSGSPWLSNYLNAAKETMSFTLSDLTSGSALNIYCTSALFTTGEIDRSKEWVSVPVDVQFLPTATDAKAGGVSPGNVTVANTVSTSY